MLTPFFLTIRVYFFGLFFHHEQQQRIVFSLHNDCPVVIAQSDSHRAVHDTVHQRQKYGEYDHLVQEPLLDVALFEAFFRLTKQQFELLLKAESMILEHGDVKAQH